MNEAKPETRIKDDRGNMYVIQNTTNTGFMHICLLAGTAIVGCKSKYEDPSVTSNSKKHVYTDLLDNIIITAFHPISYPEVLTQEQFDLAADAGIDVMEYCGAMRVTDPASMKLALQFAANAGILCNVYDDRIQNNALSMSREELFAIFNEYKGRDGLGGYYILDEAVSPNVMQN